MKKTILVSSVFAFLSLALHCPVLASSPDSHQQRHQLVPTNTVNYGNNWRFGVGAAIEYNNVNARLKLQYSQELSSLSRGVPTIHQFEKQIQGAPTIEFGKFIGRDFYLGLQASWRYSGAKNNTARTDIADRQYLLHEFRFNHYSNLLLKPGYKLNPCTMAYGLFGLSIANWRHTSYQYNGNLNASSIVDKLSMSKTAVGLGLGIGFEYLIRKDFAVSVDYLYQFQSAASSRSNFSFTQITPVVGGPPPPPPIVNTITGTVNRKLDLSHGTLAARFTWFFNL